MENTEKIKKKVVKPATTVKDDGLEAVENTAEAVAVDDGMVTVVYSRNSSNYPGTGRVSAGLAKILENSGKAIIKK